MLSKNFSREEFACHDDCGFDTIDAETLTVLQDLRDFLREPVTITSAARCLKYNRSIGSKDTSQHTKGRAVDVATDSPSYVYNYLNVKYSDKYGIGIYDTFVHIDTRPDKARWDNRT